MKLFNPMLSFSLLFIAAIAAHPGHETAADGKGDEKPAKNNPSTDGGQSSTNEGSSGGTDGDDSDSNDKDSEDSLGPVYYCSRCADIRNPTTGKWTWNCDWDWSKTYSYQLRQKARTHLCPGGCMHIEGRIKDESKLTETMKRMLAMPLSQLGLLTMPFQRYGPIGFGQSALANYGQNTDGLLLHQEVRLKACSEWDAGLLREYGDLKGCIDIGAAGKGNDNNKKAGKDGGAANEKEEKKAMLHGIEGFICRCLEDWCNYLPAEELMTRIDPETGRISVDKDEFDAYYYVNG